MSNPLVLRPCARPLASTILTGTSAKPPSLTTTRLESTARRHVQRLRVPPSPSFANTSIHHDHIVFNPPSAAPNVYHTPMKFLPQGDRRRDLYAATQRLASSQPAGTSPIAATGTPLSTTSPTHAQPQLHHKPTPADRLPPPVRQPYEKKYHLTEEDVNEIRRLRAEDPAVWTRIRLAEKFECSEFFIGLVAPNEQRSLERRQRLEQIRQRWGRQKREAREDRSRRREMWGRDL
ncbi:hypothetical protein K490DRAFT_70251 [Saccharata proteae CBS 121410]|uniref:60S ribosomal protein L20 n=1 Tax=Saccharata proteae CBS 121410 TaxID=1314787 RepID=A0A9P4M310_9PEZI|nr:hypothetical protein K490DRAFT_70251 [Saccharata proteae CBS 121410]